jgi:DNA-directed RNA polymerase specialized sigma24 family protein
LERTNTASRVYLVEPGQIEKSNANSKRQLERLTALTVRGDAVVDRSHSPLLDRQGRPLASHLQEVLKTLVPKLLRQFPVLKDDFLLTEVLEEAGRRVADHERKKGALDRLRGFTWVTVRNVATSRVGRQSARLSQRTLPAEESHAALSAVTAEWSSQREIERDILFREVLTSLAPDERVVCVWKVLGFSSREIARHRRSSVAAVDALVWRVKQKIRGLYQVGRRAPKA